MADGILYHLQPKLIRGESLGDNIDNYILRILLGNNYQKHLHTSNDKKSDRNYGIQIESKKSTIFLR